ncbi:protein BatD [Chryseobacterium sp. SNU WT5]|uniref:BatD family protein n=1 Tax=Chryseobacterium sp. SNU WT5 TaxID=2594269 RepID=UPI00117F5CF4|nr:BatD family protein [Chryseobacterium sp. SNU WT5]QDP85933.1 protein BatD [Chryseobacterium sp. SNU WT5]
MKYLFSYILTLFSTVLAYGQVTLAISKVADQKVKGPFNLTILLEISGENMEQQTPLMMPDLSKFDIIGSASDRNTIILDGNKGSTINQLVYQYVLSPKQAGTVKIGSVLVKVNGKTYKTEPFDINIRENEKTSVADHTDKNDLYLNLEVKNKVVYKDQPTIAVLKAYSKNYDNFRKVGKIQLSHQKNANIKQVSFAKSEIETKAGVSSQVIGVFMVFPTEAGTVQINPISASLSHSSKHNKITSNRAKINVKNLPEGMPMNYKNAVGNFTSDLKLLNTNEISEIDKPLNIILKISGNGNLGSLHLPKIIKSDDYLFYEPKISTSTSTKNDQLLGFVSAQYVVIPKKAGRIKLKFEDFSYFDPQANNYIDLGAEELVINVQTPAQIADAKTTLEKVNDYTNTVLETVNTPVLKTQNLIVKNGNTVNWSIIIGNISLLAALLSLFFIITQKKQKKKMQPKLISKPSSSIAETEEILRKNLSNHFEESIEYLKILKDNNNFITFFSSYEELKNETKEKFAATSDSDFLLKLEQLKGKGIAEEYRLLSEKVQIEKFAPLHFDRQIDNLYESIVTLYSKIHK